MSEYVLTTEAARILNRSYATVHHYERTGRLPAVRTGSGVRLFRRADVERLAAELITSLPDDQQMGNVPATL